MFFPRILIALALLSATFLATAGQEATPEMASPRPARGAAVIDAFYRPPAPMLPGDPGTLIRWEPIAAPPGVRAWRILYHSTGLGEEDVAVSGAVFVPDQPLAAGVPLVAMGHNTTGIARVCAPSLDPFQPQFGADEAFFAQQAAGFVNGGFAVVATDYQGLGAVGGAHPFLVGEVAARNLLDAARAVRSLPGLDLAPETILWGHSQGGHAAAWAGQLAPAYAPGMEITGIVLAAPAAEPGLVLAAAASGPPEPTPLTGYIVTLVASWSEVYPELATAPGLTAAARAHRDLLAHECIPAVTAAYGDRPLADYVNIETLLGQPWTGRIEQNAAGRQPIAAPVLVVQGTADPLVPAAATQAWVNRLCALGTDVELTLYPDVGHGAVIAAAMPGILTWIGDRRAGKAPASACDALEAGRPLAEREGLAVLTHGGRTHSSPPETVGIHLARS